MPKSASNLSHYRKTNISKSKGIQKKNIFSRSPIGRIGIEQLSEDQIYYDSSENLPENMPVLEEIILKQEENSEKENDIKEEDISESMDQKSSQPYDCSIRRKKKQKMTLPFNPSQFKKVRQIDFEVYTKMLARTKIYGSLLIDKSGRIIWCDKMTHELLEGSLNKFKSTRIQNLLLQVMLPYFLQQMNEVETFDYNTVFSWILYSKNLKRRYYSLPLPEKLTAEDIYFRFLKCLTVRVRPICISLPSYRDSKGFANEELIPQDEYFNCYFLELRHSQHVPNLSKFDIMNDPIIKRFLQNTKAKSSKSVVNALSHHLVKKKVSNIDVSEKNLKSEQDDFEQKINCESNANEKNVEMRKKNNQGIKKCLRNKKAAHLKS